MAKLATTNSPYNIEYDLSNCDKEPIHLIQTIQSFACLISASRKSLIIDRVSSNTKTFLNLSVGEVLGKKVEDIFPNEVMNLLHQGIEKQSFAEINPIVIPGKFGQEKDESNKVIIAHLSGEELILELERNNPKENNLHFLNKIDVAIQRIQSKTVTKELFKEVVQQVKMITGYDRVMLYRFDVDYNGEVVAEDKEDQMESFLGLHYPATDIPKQARDAFLSNRVRMIIDVDDDLSMVKFMDNSNTADSLNVGNCAARGASPIHLEYLRNMGVQATLSVAIVEDGKLWGLIACHHNEKRVLGFYTRNLIRFMGQIVSGHLSLSRANEYRVGELQRNIVHARLFEYMNEQRDIILGLTNGTHTIVDYISCCGAAVVINNKIEILGRCPDHSDIVELVDWLDQEKTNKYVYSTDCLRNDCLPAKLMDEDFAGLLSVKISDNPSQYILWFRNPQVKEVIWGGDPTKSIELSADTGRLTPRKSFKQWKEIVANCSIPWTKSESDAAILLRNDIKDVLLDRFHELRKLHNDLKMSYKELESFSYTISHDLRSPLRGIEGFAQILLEDYVDKLDSYGVEVVNTIVSSTEKMNFFINDILTLSKIANQSIIYEEIDMLELIQELKEEIEPLNKAKHPVAIQIEGKLINLNGDRTLLKQLFSNLINNGIKYSRPIEKAFIQIISQESSGKIIYVIRDNGIGFDMKFKNKIFEVFSRLVTEEDYEGTGVGLSIVNRVIKRHQGQISVQSEIDKGTTFHLSFPKINSQKSS